MGVVDNAVTGLALYVAFRKLREDVRPVGLCESGVRLEVPVQQVAPVAQVLSADLTGSGVMSR